MALLEQLRALGLPMRGSYQPQAFTTEDETGEQVTVMRQQWFGWTTDRTKADAAREAGAHVTTLPASDPRYSGWEVSVTKVVDG